MGKIFVTREELAAGVDLPAGEHTRIVVVGKAVCTALLGAAFETNKSFLLPQCLPGLRTVHQLLVDRGEAELLIVGHTDATAEPAVNDPLSLARAKMAQAWVEDDVNAWLSNYGSDVAESQRWGSREDHLMIRSTPPGADPTDPAAKEDPISRFQRTRSLKIDGIAGDETRTALIKEYFAQARGESSDEQTSTGSTQEAAVKVKVVAHGAGENYPLSSIAPILDARKKAAAKGIQPETTPDNAQDEEEPLDRRVEFFLYSVKTGIDPKPGKPNGPEYLRWVTDATVRKEIVVEDTRLRLPVVELEDVLFATNSAVPLPLNPIASPANPTFTTTTDEPKFAPPAGTPLSIARVLSYGYQHPEQGLHVSGHADTTADAATNDPLSEKRALAVLALIEGDREGFKIVADEKCVDSDKTDILRWASGRFGFGSAPEEHRGNLVNAIKAFQTSYNDSVERNAAGQAILDVDGDFGPLTWGATFDLYEAEIATILDGSKGEADRELLAAYRDQLRFADAANKSRGYGERYPIDQKRKNNFRSQANRRVEVLFLDPAETPSLGTPDDAVIFDDVIFRRVPLPFDGFEALPIRYALLPTEYSERRSFPKPSGLPLLRRVVKAALENTSLTVVIVGHTDQLGANEDNEKLSLARADALKALISHDLDFFTQRFEAADPFEPWAFEEVQWMLHALGNDAGPFYVGEADGHAGYVTRSALGAYQLSKRMNVDNGCDATTLEALCKDYMALIPEPLDKERIKTVAGGSWTPLLLGAEASPDEPATDAEPAAEDASEEASSFNRRVELFLFERPVVPAAETIDPTTHRTSPTYRAWARRADPQEPAAPIEYTIRLFDGRRVPLPNVAFNILRLDIESGVFEPFSSGTLNGFGTARAKLQPGPHRVDFTIGSSVESFGLHSHVDHSAGLAARLQSRT